MKDKKLDMSFMKDAFQLMVITLIAGLLLGVVYSVTFQPIQDAQAAATKKAYMAVFPEAADFSTNPESDAIIEKTAAGLAEQGFGNVLVDEIIDAKDASGSVIGHVINSTSKGGFGGAVSISTGIQQDGTVNGISFHSIAESPGLGTNARDTDWYKQFSGKKADTFSVTKAGAANDSEIDAIAGATITSRAVTGAVNAALYVVSNGVN